MIYSENYFNDVKRVIKHIPNVEELNNKSILITGATGLICSNVVDILYCLNKEGANIKILLAGRSEERTKNRFKHMEIDKDYSFVYYDATKTTSLDVKTDYIIHGASNASPAVYVSQPVETMEANFIGLNNLMKLAVENKTKRVLYLSSSEVYGQKDSTEPYHEEDYGFVDILNQRASYPSSKRAAETLCAAYALEYNLDSVIVRPGHIYGPAVIASDNRATAQFTRNAVKKEDIVMKSAGTQLRSYTFSLDCASAILAVLINGESLNAYNISNPNSIITISEIAKCLAKAAGTNLTYENPDALEAKGYNMMSNSSLDSTKLEALGWAAEFSPEEGAVCCVKYYSE